MSITLAPYACSDHQSRGRRYAEPKPTNRSEYQRDRDRIIHSVAFRTFIVRVVIPDIVGHDAKLHLLTLGNTKSREQDCHKKKQCSKFHG